MINVNQGVVGRKFNSRRRHFSARGIFSLKCKNTLYKNTSFQNTPPKYTPFQNTSFQGTYTSMRKTFRLISPSGKAIGCEDVGYSFIPCMWYFLQNRYEPTFSAFRQNTPHPLTHPPTTTTTHQCFFSPVK